VIAIISERGLASASRKPLIRQVFHTYLIAAQHG